MTVWRISRVIHPSSLIEWRRRDSQPKTPWLLAATPPRQTDTAVTEALLRQPWIEDVAALWHRPRFSHAHALARSRCPDPVFGLQVVGVLGECNVVLRDWWRG